MTTSLGFTGTQAGMTEPQFLAVMGYLVSRSDEGPLAVHHGDCIGADAEVHSLLLGLKAEGRAIEIHIHPPMDDKLQAHCLGGDVSYPPLAYLGRNRAIVAATSTLIATPRKREEVLRSGTWATVRAARKARKPIVLMLPSGGVLYPLGDPE